MSGRFLIVLLLVAAVTTAASFFYTHHAEETISDPGLTDLQRRVVLHGWPWGYYAEVADIVQLGEGQVAIMEYSEVRFEQLGQTYLVWFLVWLLLAVVFLIVAAPKQKRA